MRISNDMNYDAVSNYRKIELQNEDGSVVRKQAVSAQPEDFSVSSDKTDIKVDKDTDTANRDKLLPAKDVVDFAISNDLKSDKDLIGKDAALENLDLKKAISDMQRDSILREYQVFIQNPESEDGIVRRVARQ